MQPVRAHPYSTVNERGHKILHAILYPFSLAVVPSDPGVIFGLHPTHEPASRMVGVFFLGSVQELFLLFGCRWNQPTLYNFFDSKEEGFTTDKHLCLRR